MHRVGRTFETEDQLVARSNNLGAGHALPRVSRAHVGPRHPLSAIELGSP